VRPPRAAQEPADSARCHKHKECGQASVLHETKQDLNDDCHQERKDRAEHSGGGYRPDGPGWKTVHGITAC
jgi:hypothetical protein